MGNITFEQLPQAVSTLIERVEQLAGKVDEVLGKAQEKTRASAACFPLKKSPPCSANRLPPSMP